MTGELGPPDESFTGPQGLRRWASWLADYPIPFFAIGGLALGLALSYVALRPDLARIAWFATLVFGGLPLVIATVRRLLRKEFASDVIASVAIIAAIALDQSFAGAIIVLMQSGGEAFEGYAHRRATASLDRLVRRVPRWAYRYHGATVARIPAEEVRPGDRLVIRNGDVIPVDGSVLSPSASLDEAAVTGEPLPRTRHTGELVYSGAVNVGLRSTSGPPVRRVRANTRGS